MEGKKSVIVTATIPQEDHVALKADSDSKGMKFGAYVAMLLRDRVIKLQPKADRS